MASFILASGDNRLNLSREEALRLELKLNLTKRDKNYTVIGDDLYRFHCDINNDDVNRDVSSEEFTFLSKLQNVKYDDVVKNPEPYKTL